MIFDFLKWSKDLNLKEVCEKSETQKEIKKVFQKTYSEVYLLTHPFYSRYFEDRDINELSESSKLLSRSIKNASKRNENLAILTLESDEKCMLDDITYMYLCKIYKIMSKSFNWSLYTRVQTGWFYEEKWHKLPIKFSKPLDWVKVTARWVYWERCVLSSLSGFSEVHNIQESNCFLDIDESIMRKRKKDNDYDDDLILCPEWEKWLISLDEIIRRKENWRSNHSLNRDKN